MQFDDIVCPKPLAASLFGCPHCLARTGLDSRSCLLIMYLKVTNTHIISTNHALTCQKKGLLCKYHGTVENP